MLRPFVIAASALALLTSCTARPPIDQAQRLMDVAHEHAPVVTQQQARALIVAHKRDLFKDPDSVKDTFIGQPLACLTGPGDCVCIEANARNSYASPVRRRRREVFRRPLARMWSAGTVSRT